MQTEEEASQGIKEKMSTNSAPVHGQDVHVTRDVVTELESILVGEGARARREAGWVPVRDSGPGRFLMQHPQEPRWNLVGEAPSLKV